MSVASVLDDLTIEGELVEKLPGQVLRCTACAHRCRIQPGGRGVCKLRFNHKGSLRVPWGYVAALQADPIEKKPFSHFLPGATALTFGMLGCDFHCGYCQNWFTSQALRDPESDGALNLVRRISPQEMVQAARKVQAQVIVSSYNEPLITAEWARAIFVEAQAAGLKCAFVSNGNATPEVLAYLRPTLNAYKVDLKSMQPRNYRSLGGVLQNVLDTIRGAYDLGLWVEVVTLLVPGFNDSNEELFEMANFLRSISVDIPWHITAFHKDYKMTSPGNTPAESLVRAADLGREAGLNYVYAGNLPGRVGEYEDTCCPRCNRTLIQRRGYTLNGYSLDSVGACPACGTKISGIWSENPSSIRLSVQKPPFPLY